MLKGKQIPIPLCCLSFHEEQLQISIPFFSCFLRLSPYGQQSRGMACFFAAHEETIVFLLVDVLIKPMALLPAKWERSWSPTCSKGNSGINLNNERKNLDSVVLTDNIQIIFIPAAIKSGLPQRDGKQFQRASPFPTLFFILFYRPEMISFQRSSILLLPKNNNDHCEAYTPRCPLTFPEISQRSG